MDQQEQVATGHRRRSEVEIAELVAAYETSGLSRLEFCQKHGLSPATLSRYRKRQQGVPAEAPGTRRWVRVEVAGVRPTTASGLAVVVSQGRRIEVGRGFDAETLTQLVGLLERS